MNDITVNKAKLLKTLRKNRDEHRNIFLEAQKGYRKKVIEIMDAELEHARKGEPFVLSRLTRIVAPSDHTADYERAISMLEWERKEEVQVTSADFRAYVQDEWGWGTQWALSNSVYTSSPKMDKYLSESDELR